MDLLSLPWEKYAAIVGVFAPLVGGGFFLWRQSRKPKNLAAATLELQSCLNTGPVKRTFTKLRAMVKLSDADVRMVLHSIGAERRDAMGQEYWGLSKRIQAAEAARAEKDARRRSRLAGAVGAVRRSKS